MMTQTSRLSSRFFRLTSVRFAGFALGASLLGASACKSKSNPERSPTARASSAAGNAAATPPPSATSPKSVIVPQGPAFAIEAGVGLGPVRFGATVATIERLMEGKCDEITETYCRYIGAGIEYELTKGVVSGMVVHRHDRPVAGSPGKAWGRTRCAIPPDVTPRTLLSYVRSVLGKPLASEAVTADNPNRTGLRETYKGLILEFDRGEHTGELILGGIRVTKAAEPPRHPADAPPVH